ncbi:carbon monoxide dehydrogenase [Nocardioides sp. CF8]|nr:carbon monoxide dehydrogenase [Nocardioides sp. CF8]
MWSAVELGQLHRQQRVRGLGRLRAQVHEAGDDLAVQRLADLRAVDRAGGLVGDLGAVAGGVEAHPALDGDLAGGWRGDVVRRRATVLGGEPAAVHQHARTVSQLQGDHDVDARGTVTGAIAHHDGVLDGIGAGGGDALPLVVGRQRRTGRHHVGDGHRGLLLVALDDGVAVPAVLQPVELPLAQSPRHPGQRDHGQEEQHPPTTQQEPEPFHRMRLAAAPP